MLKPEDFPSLEAFNDFLEDKEDIIFCLATRVQVQDAEARLNKWKTTFREKIAANRMEKTMEARRKVAEEQRLRAAAAERSAAQTVAAAPSGANFSSSLPQRLERLPESVIRKREALSSADRQQRAWIAGGYKTDYVIKAAIDNVQDAFSQLL
jgi:CDK-activating kinase assembly factor MAT1